MPPQRRRPCAPACRPKSRPISRRAASPRASPASRPSSAAGTSDPGIAAAAGSPCGPAGRADRRPDPVRDRQQHQGLHRGADPEARGGGSAGHRPDGRRLAAAIPGLGQGQHPPPPEHDQRHPDLQRGAALHARPGGGHGTATSRRSSSSAYAYPRPGNQLPPSTGWFYSNTNYILAGMIAAKAGGARLRPSCCAGGFSSRSGWRTPSTRAGSSPADVIERMASGYFENPTCSLLPARCTVGPLALLVGKDMRKADLTWTGAAGRHRRRRPAIWPSGCAACSAGGSCRGSSSTQMMQLVSIETGKPIAHVTPQRPSGFGSAWPSSFIPVRPLLVLRGGYARLPRRCSPGFRTTIWS